MRRLKAALGITAFTMVLAGAPVFAQGVSRYSADVTVGFWLQRTDGRYKDPDGGGVGGELSVARRFHTAASSGLVATINGAHYAKIGSNDSCTLLPGGACAPELPSIRLVGALAGWETRSGWLRAMGGLAYADPTSGGGTLAIQARVDAVVPVVRHLALTASVRPALLPSYRGDTFKLLGVGIGARIR